MGFFGFYIYRGFVLILENDRLEGMCVNCVAEWLE